MSLRIKNTFKKKNKKIIAFTTGGDPNFSISKNIVKIFVKNKIDLIEIGMPFSDPMADGPTIQQSSLRAIDAGITLKEIFEITKFARMLNKDTPIILMGYYNIIFNYGIKKFVKKCDEVGVDGLIVVDLQPEEDNNLFKELKKHNIDLIRLITPTTNEQRLKSILLNATGFLYYVTVTGITGQKSANIKELKKSITKIRNYSPLPIVAGFGIKNVRDVRDVCKIADGAVVGSSIVKLVEKYQKNKKQILKTIDVFTKKLKNGTIL
ncbi:MAG: tryptophan synthase subunit alpha [Pelagibacteraceae bacterium]|nr:tryptophan synthase subunit alpha [Pelagibacteraceae bacterium]|tara:strand:- start:4667 stop:5461 length:795 start_codon:yes stop_codon:yes gene_type:complete